MFIENPHGFGRINRRAAADGYNHIRLEFTHSFGTFPDGFDGGIRRNAFHNAGFQAIILQYLFCFLQETAPTHGMAAGADEGSLMALQHSQFLNGTITCIDISWQCKTEHKNLLLFTKDAGRLPVFRHQGRPLFCLERFWYRYLLLLYVSLPGILLLVHPYYNAFKEGEKDS